MQSLRSLLVPAVLVTWTLHAPGPVAQEPRTPEPRARAERSRPGNESPRAQSQDPRRGRGRSGGRRRGLTVIEAAVVHPVSGPPIENGVVVIRGERILAVGLQGELELPANTQIYKYPNGHVYPGLIDASTDAFTDDDLRKDNKLNGGSELSEALVWTGDRDDQLIRHGVTTAYVSVRSSAQVRGQGAIVRPHVDRFELWEDKEQAALQLRMATGTESQHPLQRQAQLAAAEKLFNGLEDYRDAKEKFDKDLEKYNKDFEKYLEHHRKKNGKDEKKSEDEPEKSEGKQAEEPAEAPEGRRRGRGPGGRRRPPEGGGEGGETEDLLKGVLETDYTRALALIFEQQASSPAPQDPRGRRRPTGGRPAAAAEQKPADGKPEGEGGKKEEDGPKRPKYPKRPKVDPQKDALAKVIDGVMPLRVEAQRVEELRAALRLQRDNDVPLMVLEHAYAAGSIADEIAAQSTTVVLTNVMPHALGAPGEKRNPFAKFDVAALPRQLDEAGVPFAIASGSARLASVLTMMAANAVGAGASPEAVLRALTLTPAEILGVADDTGSLTRDKFADVLVTDGPLFASDSRVLLVLSKGRTEFERD